jgi:hypothetical protein
LLHVHIGLSPLAQALILPVAESAGLQTCVIGREDGVRPPAGNDGCCVYELRWEGPEPEREQRVICSYEQPSRMADLPTRILEQVRNDRRMLLTATLRDEGVLQRQRFSMELLKARPRDSETVVIPCENRVPDAWRKIEQEVGCNDVTFLRCVVNRIAVRFEEEGAPAGTRVTRTHPSGEWLVEDPGRELVILDLLKRAAEFEVVESLEPYKLRKLYLVNGGHLAVAIHGAKLQIPSLRDTARRRDCLLDVTNLHNAMIFGMSSGPIALLDHPHDYAKEQVEAYCEVADQVSRIMTPLRRADLVPFLSTVEERLSRPAMLTTAAAEYQPRPHIVARNWLEPYIEVFNRLEFVLKNHLSYSDVTPSSERTFLREPNRDELAVEAYDQCLTGWMQDDSKRDRRVLELRQALSDQRAMLERRGTPQPTVNQGEAVASREGRVVANRRWDDA